MLSAIGVAMICIHFFDEAVIIGSAVIGSYFFFRGISAFLGGYPNEFEIYQNYTNGTPKAMPVSFYMYTAIMVVTAGASFGMQRQMRMSNASEYSYRQEYNYRKA